MIASSGFDFFASFGYAIAARGKPGFSLDVSVSAVASWYELIQTAAAKAAKRTCAAADLIAHLWEDKLAIGENGFRAIPLTL